MILRLLKPIMPHPRTYSADYWTRMLRDGRISTAPVWEIKPASYTVTK